MTVFVKESSHIRILSVLDLSWGRTDKRVEGRPFAALTLRICGDGALVEDGKNELLKSGDVVYMPKGVGYDLHCGEERVLVIHFDVQGEGGPHMEVFHPENTANLHRLFAALLDVWREKRPGYAFRSLSLFYEIVYELEKNRVRERTVDYERIERALEYLHAAYMDPDLTVRELCRKVAMSDTYFRRLFYSCYGKTPLRYLNDLRIDYAKALLREGDCPVTEAAYRSGFADPKYFSTAFRHAVGCSPSAYRKGEK